MCLPVQKYIKHEAQIHNFVLFFFFFFFFFYFSQFFLQLNEITPWLDGGLIYGTTKAWSDHLRLYKNGTMAPRGLLATSHDGLFPDYNTLRLPMANPPPPFYHRDFAMKHETFKVDRFFSKLCYLFQNTKPDVNERCIIFVINIFSTPNETVDTYS